MRGIAPKLFGGDSLSTTKTCRDHVHVLTSCTAAATTDSDDLISRGLASVDITSRARVLALLFFYTSFAVRDMFNLGPVWIHCVGRYILASVETEIIFQLSQVEDEWGLWERCLYKNAHEWQQICVPVFQLERLLGDCSDLETSLERKKWLNLAHPHMNSRRYVFQQSSS